MVGRIFIGVFWIGCSIPESDFPEEVAETQKILAAEAQRQAEKKKKKAAA